MIVVNRIVKNTPAAFTAPLPNKAAEVSPEKTEKNRSRRKPKDKNGEG